MEARYKPFDSDSGEDESSSDGYTTEESLMNISGKDNSDETTEYAVRKISNESSLEGSPAILYESIGEDSKRKEQTGTAFVSVESRNTSLFMINSRDRDNRAFPQPTYFTIRLPHVYKNVTSVNIAQINLLNSFFNFTQSSGNTNMYVQEEGREPVNVQIRDGTYGVSELVTELTSALNATPLFADISFQTFFKGFQTSGDFTTLFNVPGPTVYNSLLQTYEYGKTINDIVARYFNTVLQIGVVNYTANECYVAYYYPIVKEMTIQGIPFSYANQVLPSTYSSWYEYIVFSFTGLDDPYITAIVLDTGNQVLFDNFHYQNTFLVSLVNTYTCEYNTKQGRLTIRAPSLNQSIANDLSNQYTNILTSILYNQNPPIQSIAQFNTQYSNAVKQNGTLLGFYNFLQSQFTYFGVDFGKYAYSYYVNPSNPVVLYNTTNRYGWNTSLTPQVANSTITSVPSVVQTSTLCSNISFPTSYSNSYPFLSTISFQNGPVYFPNASDDTFGYLDAFFPIRPTSYIQTTVQSPIRQSLNFMTLPRTISTINNPSTNLVYDLSSAVYLVSTLNNNPDTYVLLTDLADANFDLYMFFQSMFNDPEYMRQDNQWLSFTYSQILAGVPQTPNCPLIQKEYSTIQYPPPFPSPIISPFYNNPSINNIAIQSYRPYLFVQVNASQYAFDPLARFRVTFYVEPQAGGKFVAPILVTWYKDRAGFMADVNSVIHGGKEDSRNYFAQSQATVNDSTLQMTMYVNNSQITYFIIRPNEGTTSIQVPLRFFCNLTDESGIYTQASVEDGYDMPYQIASLQTQTSPSSAKYQFPLPSIYDSNIFKLGYDKNGISNNLLDYFIQGNYNNYYDPTNTRYLMNAQSAAGPPAPTISSPTQWSLYFGSNTSYIADTSTNTIYASTNTNLPLRTQNEYSLVNWFVAGVQGNNPEPIERYYQTSNISTNTTFLPCYNPTNPLITDISTCQLEGYDTNNLVGIGIYLPPNQFVEMQSLVLKFAYTQPNANANRTSSPPAYSQNQVFQESKAYVNTKSSIFASWDDWFVPNRRNTKLGIFLASTITNVALADISISSAICTMSLESISQIANYTDSTGGLKRREPEWGTYYKYVFQTSSYSAWDISGNGFSSNLSTQIGADFAPSTTLGFSYYPNTFRTPALTNYTYLPRSFGVAPSIVYSTIQSQDDIDASYVVLPFYYDRGSNDWVVGRLEGLTFTRVPCLPTATLLGAAPYYGPTGGYAWFASNDALVSDGSFAFWNANLTFHNYDIVYNPATDLTLFGGITGIENEYQNTYMFVYSNSNKATADITNSNAFETSYVWGQESASNYSAADDRSGYNFLSYIDSFPVIANNSYVIQIRAYDPIPSFYTGLRVIGKNTTDFGEVSFENIIKEITSLQTYTPITNAMASTYVQNLYTNPPNISSYINQINSNNVTRGALSLSSKYSDALVNFDKSFSTTQKFGTSYSYVGSTFTFVNFSDCYTKYSTLYANVVPVFQNYVNILSTASGQLTEYTITKYSNILPPFALERNNLSDPIPFQLMLSTFIDPKFANQYDSWGLGYNLGFQKADTPPQPRTVVVADTFIRIVQNYIYLKISPELNMNRLAVSNKENLAETHDPSAEDLKYFSKILLNNFGSYCQAAVQMPVKFTPVLGKLDTISFQLLDNNGIPINNVDCEFDLVLSVEELQYTQKDNSTVLKPDV